jgi:plastocyanin
MRCFSLAVALTLGALYLAPGDAEARGHRFGRGRHHGPAIMTHGSAPCPPAYRPSSYFPGPQLYSYPAPVSRQAVPLSRPIPPAASAMPALPGYAPSQPTTTVRVAAFDNYFEPRTLTVLPGTTVRWANYGMHDHTVTSHAGLFDSGDLSPGSSYAATFTQPGTYSFYCRHHTQDRMEGTIVVGPGGNGGARSPGY